MDRKKFIKNSLVGIGAIKVMGAIPTVMTAYSKAGSLKNGDLGSGCTYTPRETAGPFTNKTPAQLVRENIAEDRRGVGMLMNLTVESANKDCQSLPLSNVYVDAWHCDAKGNYSQYGRTEVNKNYLRGRQLTNVKGQVSFISVFPGWYPGRAPHIHIEVLDTNEKSLLVTQIAFPKDVCDKVYDSKGYVGEADTLNEDDHSFDDSLSGNMLGSITGDMESGYTLFKKILV